MYIRSVSTARAAKSPFAFKGLLSLRRSHGITQQHLNWQLPVTVIVGDIVACPCLTCCLVVLKLFFFFFFEKVSLVA